MKKKILAGLILAVWAAGGDGVMGATEEAEEAVALARQIQAWQEAGKGKELEAAGLELGARAGFWRRVWAEMARPENRVDPALQGEMLVWAARGDDRKKQVGGESLPTEELGRLAGEWLHHRDPFARGLAEWALAIRLGFEYEGTEERVEGRRIFRKWPGPEEPGWYQDWLELGPDTLVEQDHVRQAAGLGWHRTEEALEASARKLLARGQAMREELARRWEGSEKMEGVHRAWAEMEARGREFLAAGEGAPGDLTERRRQWLGLRQAGRRLALANPDLDFEEVVFGLRQATPGNGNITNGRWNAHTPGGGIFRKGGFDPEDAAVPLLEGRLGPGHVRGLELNWEADKLVFAFARQPAAAGERPVLRAKSAVGGYFGQGVGEAEEYSHLFEVGIDGNGLRQLTDDPFHADQEPAYLPNGDIVFVSDRSNFGSQCAGALDQDNMILNLYRCSPNGENVRPLSNNKDFDRHPHVLDSGLVLFLRWEYQERHLWNTHTLWTARPDGSMTDALYKQHINQSPMSLREGRPIRGTDKLVAIACGHHNYDQGAIFVVDPSLGINNPAGMRNLTPGAAPTEGGYGRAPTVAEGGVEDAGGHYMFPYPLSERSFLAAYSYKLPERSAGRNFGLYYLDVWGNKELLHRDKHLSVAFLAPVRAVPRPPVVRDLEPPRESGPRHAVAMVADVHRGWPEAEQGRVKYLRIAQKVPWPCVEDPEKACGFNDLHWMPSAWEPVLGMWDWSPTRVIGIVPVEADGSAHFKVPADQTVYFQALDENLLEVRRMRSNLTFRAGETRSCVGCHESQSVIPPAGKLAMPLAMRREPSTPEPPPWGDRALPDFEEHIQPIFERHCVRCHGSEKPEGGIELTGRRVDGYLQSYRTLFGLQPGEETPFPREYRKIWMPGSPPATAEQNEYARQFRKVALERPPEDQLVRLADYMGGSEVSKVGQFGSGQSKLTLALVKDPLHVEEAALSREEWMALVTWVDLNAQYWGTFVDKDQHYLERMSGEAAGDYRPPRRVVVEYPDPWSRSPAGKWVWKDASTAGLSDD